MTGSHLGNRRWVPIETTGIIGIKDSWKVYMEKLMNEETNGIMGSCTVCTVYRKTSTKSSYKTLGKVSPYSVQRAYSDPQTTDCRILKALSFFHIKKECSINDVASLIFPIIRTKSKDEERMRSSG